MAISGSFALPGDKSLSHRALMLGALTDGKSVINNISTGKDVESTRQCLMDCGIKSIKLGNSIEIFGGGFTNPSKVLNCGNSGTTVRLISGLLAGQGISAKFIGDGSLSERPMNRIIEPLNKMGVQFQSDKGCLPISMVPNVLKNISYTASIASAQVKSAILLAALGAEGKTIVYEPIKTRDHTEIMLMELGANIKLDENIEIMKLSKPLNRFTMNIPSDPSSSAFFAALACIVPNSSIEIKRVLINKTRMGFYNTLKKMGAEIEIGNKRYEYGEPVGDIKVFYSLLNGINIDKEVVPSIIDEIPILAVIASQADGPTIISGAAELRVKESDRIKAICTNLLNMGCDVIEKKDGFIINPGNKLYNTNINSFKDHRIAMAFTIAGYLTDKKNKIDSMDCINISFPEFTEILATIDR